MPFVPTIPPAFADELVPGGTKLAGYAALVSALEVQALACPRRRLHAAVRGRKSEIGRVAVAALTR